MKHFLLIALLLPLASLGQIRITGKVINAADHKPVANASVFLSNATVGSKTADDGTFTLVNVRPGQYEFVVSVVGFDAHRQKVMAGAEDIALPDISLTTKTTQLKEVAITGTNDWERNFTKFNREFLGTSVAAEDCKITNYDALTLDYDAAAQKLSGSSTDFLEVENKYLGYKIKYLLNDFRFDYATGMLYYGGSTLFEELGGSLSQKRRWQKRRKEVYYGSSMHFLRTVLLDSTQQADFTVNKLIFKPNPKYIKGSTEPPLLRILEKTPLKSPEYLHDTDLPGIYAIGFKDPLYVKYRKNTFGTIININAKYAFFDSNGIIINPADVIFEGGWGRSRVAEMLPVDYEPEVAAKNGVVTVTGREQN